MIFAIIALLVFEDWIPLFLLAIPPLQFALWRVSVHRLYAAANRRVIVFSQIGKRQTVQSCDLSFFQREAKIMEIFAPSGDIIIPRKLNGRIPRLSNLSDVHQTYETLRAIAQEHPASAGETGSLSPLGGKRF